MAGASGIFEFFDNHIPKRHRLVTPAQDRQASGALAGRQIAR
jgi:hypothetical protein